MVSLVQQVSGYYLLCLNMLADSLDQFVNGLLISHLLCLCKSVLNGLPMSFERHLFERLGCSWLLFRVYQRGNYTHLLACFVQEFSRLKNAKVG